MRLESEKIKKLAQNKGLDLKTLLARAGVSKTAYYHLIRQESLLPKSIHAIAKILNLPPEQLVKAESSPALARVHRLRKMQDAILSRNPGVDPENVWHCLLLLEKSPWQRLERGLLRAQKKPKVKKFQSKS
jgi:transcriptional regulator with XRE-family HTH domain